MSKNVIYNDVHTLIVVETPRLSKAFTYKHSGHAGHTKVEVQAVHQGEADIFEVKKEGCCKERKKVVARNFIETR